MKSRQPPAKTPARPRSSAKQRLATSAEPASEPPAEAPSAEPASEKPREPPAQTAPAQSPKPPPPSRKPWVFHYENFSTRPVDFETWVDMLFMRLKLPALPGGFILAGLVFAIGLLIALPIHFADEYLRSPAPYAGLIGIALVLGVFRYASVNIHSVYEELRPCFLIPDAEYAAIVTSWFKRFQSHRGNLAMACFFLAVGLTSVYVGFYNPTLLGVAGIQSFRPKLLFPDFWYTPDYLVVKSLIVIWYGIIISLALGCSFRCLAINFLFLLSLRKLSIIPASNIIRKRLRRVADFYIFVSFAWFFGVSLFATIFSKSVDIVGIVLVGLMSLVGILTFFTPQFVFRSFMERSYDWTCDVTLILLTQKLGIEVYERTPIKINFTPTVENIQEISEINSLTNKPVSWIYSPRDLLPLIGGQLAAFGGLFVQDFVQKHIFTLFP